MNKFFQWVSIGSAVLGAVMILIPQIKSPSTLNADMVWQEISPALLLLGQATGAHINMILAEKITRDAVRTIIDAATTTA